MSEETSNPRSLALRTAHQSVARDHICVLTINYSNLYRNGRQTRFPQQAMVIILLLSLRVSHSASGTQSMWAHKTCRYSDGRRSGVSARAPLRMAMRFPPCRRPIAHRHRRRRLPNPGVLARKIQIPQRTFHGTAGPAARRWSKAFDLFSPSPTVESYFSRKCTAAGDCAGSGILNGPADSS